MTTTEHTPDALRTALAAVAMLRKTLADITAIINGENEHLKAHLAAEYAQKKITAEALATMEEEVRVLTLARYAATNEKRPIDGVEVKVGKRYSYDAADALAWAKASNVALVPESLDVAAFEKIVAASPASFAFVTVHEEPKATLGRDLSAYLPAAEVV